MAKTQGKKAAKPGKKAPAQSKKATKPAAKSKQAPKEPEEGELTEEMIEDIEADMTSLKEELNKSQKNASAARRARKLTTTLEKKFKAFRKASNDHHRKEE